MLQPHIQLDDTLNIKYAILPGDPGRLDRIALQLEKVEELAYNREFRSLRGLYKGVPVLAISTGIGGIAGFLLLLTALLRLYADAKSDNLPWKKNKNNHTS